MIIIARFLFALTLFLPLGAQASEPLIFRTETTDIRAKSALSFLQLEHGFNPAMPYQIATIDLNSDGVDEWIVRQDLPNCESNASCPYYVVGLKNKKPALIGDVKARKIGITEKKSYGIAKLVVYNDPNDDFAYRSYTWEPREQYFHLW